MSAFLIPDWPAPAGIRACVTTRAGGVSQAPFDSFNLGDHVDDDPHAVALNRQHLTRTFCVQPAWLSQVHGVVVAPADPSQIVEADASWTSTPGIACTVMTADCLPALFCNRAGTRVAAAHAGWRGLAAGVLEAAARSLHVEPQDIVVWLGPAIGPKAFEVGGEVRDVFINDMPQAASAFVPSTHPGRYMADIYELARLRLARCGIDAVYGGGFCTVTDPRFFSYRRSPRTGRFASLVRIETPSS